MMEISFIKSQLSLLASLGSDQKFCSCQIGPLFSSCLIRLNAGLAGGTLGGALVGALGLIWQL